MASHAPHGLAWLAPPVLAIESPTGIDVRLPVAGPGARAYAFMIDWVMRASLSGAWFVLAAWAFTGDFSFRMPDDAETAWFLLVVLPPSAIFFLYHLVLESLLAGRTPGKRIVGIRIVALGGGAPSLGALLLRNVFRLVDSMPFSYAVGLACVMLTREHRRIGDFAAGTLVVYDRGGNKSQRRLTSIDAVLEQIAAYRTAARQTAQARTTASALALAEVEARYGELHAGIYRPSRNPMWLLWSLFRDQIPAALHEMRAHLLWVTLWFLLSALAGGWLVLEFPDLIQLFASPQMIATVERGELWTDGLLNVAPSSVLSIEILTNNIVVALFTFVAGFLFGLGTLYIVGTNGLMLGAVFAFTSQHGLDHRLFEFVVAHGCVELSCICIAGAAGAYAGEALARPGTAKRSTAFAAACGSAGKVLLAVTALLLICGFIEGYISPDPDIPLSARIIIGLGYFVFMVGFLRGDLFGGSRNRAPVPL
jgi:uncharacterized membrane protein SpoIIM required for sporulation/uncharacterized RDD family membrane protein YckC